jgi:hypothetical protein
MSCGTCLGESSVVATQWHGAVRQAAYSSACVAEDAPRDKQHTGSAYVADDAARAPPCTPVVASPASECLSVSLSMLSLDCR